MTKEGSPTRMQQVLILVERGEELGAVEQQLAIGSSSKGQVLRK